MQRRFLFSQVIALIESARPSDRWLLRVLLAAVVLALIWLILSINSAASVISLGAGGSLQEGIVGTPRFVNPVLALTRADQDVTELVYRGLAHIDETGSVSPDIASSWAISEDGRSYTINLREDVVFHDGVPLTATDVAFTIDLVQNGDLKSPLRSNWNGVAVSEIDDYTLELTLEEPYAPFIYNLTLGILPAHIWRTIPIEQVPFSTFNTTPVGSGPYRVTDTTFSDNGTVASYQLERYEAHQPLAGLETIELQFFTDQTELNEAWQAGLITSSAYLEPSLVSVAVDSGDYTVTEVPLTRTFGLFFNQNRSSVLRDAAVREALELVLDREAIIATALDGAGIPSYRAVATGSDAVQSLGVHAATSTPDDRYALATEVLEMADWNLDDAGGTWEKDIDDDTTPLTLTIKTANVPVFDQTAAAVTEAWETLGATVVTEQFTQSDLVQSVIRERDFEVLLFGIDPGLTQDIYPFWHSAQQDDPGLNVSQYANVTVDEALDTLRTNTDPVARQTAIETINLIIQEERPALFLFKPTVQYVTPTEVTAPMSQTLSHPADRFSRITEWSGQTSRLWPIFIPADDADNE